jgi:hypothetical protein
MYTNKKAHIFCEHLLGVLVYFYIVEILKARTKLTLKFFNNSENKDNAFFMNNYLFTFI